MEIQVIKGIPRKDVYSHLLAFCNNNTLYSIIKYENQTEEDLERILISDAKAIAKDHEARGKVIGTIRLLPSGENTTIQFVNKDAIFHLPVINPELWKQFINEVKEYFLQLKNAEYGDEHMPEIQPDIQDQSPSTQNIPSMEYPGSISHFRAWMDRYLIVNGETVRIQENNEIATYKIAYMPQAREGNREVWLIELIIPATKDIRVRMETKGMILAVEEVLNKTKIEFLDGKFYSIPMLPITLRKNLSETDRRDYERPKITKGARIGKNFPEIVKSIIAGLNVKNDNKTKEAQEPTSRNLKEWFDYLHAEKHRIRITLNYIADKTKYAYSTVKKEHSLYMKENGIQKVTKSNKK